MITATSSEACASQYVVSRSSALTKRSATRSTDARISSATSGKAGASVASEKVAVVMALLDLGGAHLLLELLDRGVDHVAERLRIDAEGEDGHGEDHEERELAHAHVLQLLHVVVGDRAVHDALDHPQRIRRPGDERGRGEEGVPEAGLHRAEDHQELAHEA